MKILAGFNKFFDRIIPRKLIYANGMTKICVFIKLAQNNHTQFANMKIWYEITRLEEKI